MQDVAPPVLDDLIIGSDVQANLVVQRDIQRVEELGVPPDQPVATEQLGILWDWDC